MPEILFMVGNHYFKTCGQLPGGTTDGDDGNYHSYFENEHGEQWLFTYNRREDRVYIQGGDLGWESFGLQHIRFKVLNTEEKLWLDACLRAVGAGRLEDFVGVKQ